MSKQGMLKGYMAYSRGAGSGEGAVLVVASSVKEAKKLAWGNCLNVDDWTDQAATLIKDKTILALADKTQLQAGIPHVIESPEHCQNCELWGCGLTDDKLCSNCNASPGLQLIEKYQGFREPL